jgi:hypothetical protein
MPIILAGWKAEIWKIEAQDQPRLKEFMRCPHLSENEKKKKLGMVVDACHPSYSKRHKWEVHVQAKSKILSPK